MGRFESAVIEGRSHGPRVCIRKVGSRCPSAPSPHWRRDFQGGRDCGERVGVRGHSDAIWWPPHPSPLPPSGVGSHGKVARGGEGAESGHLPTFLMHTRGPPRTPPLDDDLLHSVCESRFLTRGSATPAARLFPNNRASGQCLPSRKSKAVQHAVQSPCRRRLPGRPSVGRTVDRETR